MSEKIPFLQMFQALQASTELSNAVAGWVIESAAIDKAQRSARIRVIGMEGAGSNLVLSAQGAICRCYGLNSVLLESVPATKPAESKPEPVEEIAPSDPAPVVSDTEDPFARTQAIREAAMKSVPRATPSGEKKEKSQGKAIYGRVIKKKPMPIGDLQ